MSVDLTLPARNHNLRLEARSGFSWPALLLLEDSSGYWLFEDSARIMGEAGDTGTALGLHTRTFDLTLEDQ